jgi:NAD(P)-dependent dehydrogenase (short-subunit alcohol dehydrogenase family)
MTWTEKDVPDQSGRVAIVTGSNTGLGYDNARVLAARGATVVMAVRDTAKGDAAADRIRELTPGAVVVVNEGDEVFPGDVIAKAQRDLTGGQFFDVAYQLRVDSRLHPLQHLGLRHRMH